MSAKKVRQKFVAFFKERGHQLYPSSSLIPENDPSVLFTTAGMQQFKDWFSGKLKPEAKRVVTIQKCLRTSDLEEVGDETHLTFFEMLGNFSFGDYFKKEAIRWAKEFLENELKIEPDRIQVSAFKGEKGIPKDEESIRILRELGYQNILLQGKKDNFWGPTGEEGPCGPTVEFLVDGVEVWNLVFNEYYQQKNGKLVPLPQKGVDTGMGLERIVAVLEGKKDVFATSLFGPLMEAIERETKERNVRYQRILADHLRSIVFLLAEGIMPSNVDRGYVLRRFIRRARVALLILGGEKEALLKLAEKVIEQFEDPYEELKQERSSILSALAMEIERYERTLQQGKRQLEKILRKKGTLTEEDAFLLYDSFGLPRELIEHYAQKEGISLNWQKFEALLEKQRQRARKAQLTKEVYSEEDKKKIARLHTATHLLHQALREILGEGVRQAGQDINPERLRFDFTFPRKLTEEELRRIEALVNEKIKEGLPVKKEIMTPEEAKKSGAIALFWDRYGEKVSVYSIGDFSKEVCRGPHAKNTAELGRFKIIKEESSGAGVRRIKAILLPSDA
ncbi:alanine--tRNA ligase [bacterium]|nr:alanine--tRNA ligase [bacterium]